MNIQDPAFPTPYLTSSHGIQSVDYLNGLTKREWMATKIAAALISFSHDGNVPNDQNVNGSVRQAIRTTDLLLVELNKPLEHNTEQIEKECREDLKEIAHFYGGWDKLKKVVQSLEENDNEAAYERMQNRG